MRIALNKLSLERAVDDHTTEFCLKDGRKVTISVTYDGDEIRVQDANSGAKVGLIVLRDTDGEYFQLTWMFLDQAGGSYLKQGIGRAALRFHKEIFCLPIVAADDDGMQKADGSHLTGNAPGFVRKMRQEGIIFQSRIHLEDDD